MAPTLLGAILPPRDYPRKTRKNQNEVELLRNLGIPEEKIRELLTAHVVGPLERLDSYQDGGLIGGALILQDPVKKEPASDA